MENADREDRDALFRPTSSRPPTAAAAAAGSSALAGSDQAAPAPGQRGGGGDRGFGELWPGDYGGGGGGWGNAAGSFEANWQQQPSHRQQQQQQPLSWAQVRDNIDVVERRQGLQSAYESVEVGREALERLDDQKG